MPEKGYAGFGMAEILFPETMFPTDGFRGIHDLPHVRIMTLDAGTRVAIACVELVNIPPDAVAEARQCISRTTGTGVENVWIHATHAITTPHAPLVGPPPGAGKPRGPVPPLDPEAPRKRKEFMEAFLTAVAIAAEQCAQSFRPAKIGVGCGHCDVNINRDIPTPFGWWVGFNPDGFSNKTATVLRVEDSTGGLMGILLSYGMKPAAIDNAQKDTGSRLVSSDVPGLACRLLEQKYRVPVLYAMAAAADQVPKEQAWGETVGEDGTIRQYDHGVETGLGIVERLGTQMAQDMAAVIESTVCKSSIPHIMTGSAQVTVPNRQETPHKPTIAPHYEPDGTETVLTAEIIALGELALVAVKPETNAITEAQLQADSPFSHTLLMSMVNGEMKYMPDQSAYHRGTWETGRSRFMPGAAEAWVAATTEALKALREEEVE